MSYDNTTRADVAINYNQHRANASQLLYAYQQWSAVADAGKESLYIYCSDSEFAAHVTVISKAGGKSLLRILRGGTPPSAQADPVPVRLIKSQTEATFAAHTKVYESVTDGNFYEVDILSAPNGFWETTMGGNASNKNELLIQPGTWLQLELQNLAGSAQDMDIRLEFFEAKTSATLNEDPGNPALDLLSGAFGPKQIMGLSSMFDTSIVDSISVINGLVNQWDDQSGHGRHAVQSIIADQPSYDEESPDGIQITNASTRQLLYSPGDFDEDLNFDFFVVFKPIDPGGGISRFLAGGDGGYNLTQPWDIFSWEGGDLLSRFGGAPINDAGPVPANAISVAHLRWDEATTEKTLDRSLSATDTQTAGTPPTSVPASFYIGAVDGNIPGDFRYYEVLTYGGPGYVQMTDAQVTALTQYLMTKWSATA